MWFRWWTYQRFTFRFVLITHHILEFIPVSFKVPILLAELACPLLLEYLFLHISWGRRIWSITLIIPFFIWTSFCCWCFLPWSSSNQLSFLNSPFAQSTFLLNTYRNQLIYYCISREGQYQKLSVARISMAWNQAHDIKQSISHKDINDPNSTCNLTNF